MKYSREKWSDEYMKEFGLAYIKYEPLYRSSSPITTIEKKKRRKCLTKLAEELELDLHPTDYMTVNTYTSRLCQFFVKKFTEKLRRLWQRAMLLDRSATDEQVLQLAPPWMRSVEAKLHRMAHLRSLSKEMRSNLISRKKYKFGLPMSMLRPDAEDLAARLATSLAAEAHSHRSLKADKYNLDNLGFLDGAVGADTVMIIWDRIKHVCAGKLRVLACVGDNPLGVCESARMQPHDWLVADALLLYSTEPLINQESYLLYEQLQPLIHVFHLVQIHGVEDPQHPRPLLYRWNKVYRDYQQRGLSASLILLQRRWCELKHDARRSILRLWRGEADKPPVHLHVALVKRFPHVVTDPLPTWEELVESSQVVQTHMDVEEENASGGSEYPSTECQPEVNTYTESEDDLILIERDIETVDLDEDDCTDGEGGHEDRLVMDVPEEQNIPETDTTPANEESSANKQDNAEPPPPNEATNVNSESDNCNKDTEKKDTTETNEVDDNNMQIDDTCIETPTIVDGTDASVCEENNSADVTLLVSQSDIPIDTSVQNEQAELSVTENSVIDESMANSSAEDLQANGGNNGVVDADKNEQVVESVTEKATNNDEAIIKQEKANTNVHNNENSRSEKSDVPMDGNKEKESENVSVIIPNKDIKQIKDVTAIDILHDLDPDKVETEIMFDSDSEGCRNSPDPGCSGLKSNRNTPESLESIDDKTKEHILEKIKDSLNNSVPKVQLENIMDVGVFSKTDIKKDVELKLEKRKWSGNTPEDKNRIVFEDGMKDSDISDDDLPIAEIKRKKYGTKIRFEDDEDTVSDDNAGRSSSCIPKDMTEDEDIEGSDNDAVTHSDDGSVDLTFSFGRKRRSFTAKELDGVKEQRTYARKASQGTKETDQQHESEEANSKRVAKRVELPNIEEIRRINRNMLTAQVTPLNVNPGNGPKEENADSKDGERGASEPRPGRPPPTEDKLLMFLSDLNRVFRGGERAAWKRHPGAKAAYCCVARRHRAVNDARRRLAAKAGHARPPAVLPLHSGKHLDSCSCCCVHLVEEMGRDKEVDRMQRALNTDLVHLLAGRALDNKSWDNLHNKGLRQKRRRRVKKNTKSKKDNQDETSERDSQTSEDDTADDWEPDVDESSGHTKSAGSSRVNSDDEEKRVTRNAGRKKKDDTSHAATSKSKDTSNADKSDGYDEWIRQKNLASRFFDMGLLREKADKKYGSKRERIEKESQSENSNQDSNQVDLTENTEVDQELKVEPEEDNTLSERNEVTAEGDDALNETGGTKGRRRLSIKIVAVTGGASAAFQDPPSSGEPSSQPPVSGGQPKVNPVKTNVSGSFASFRTPSGKVISGKIVTGTTVLRGQPSPLQTVTAGQSRALFPRILQTQSKPRPASPVQALPATTTIAQVSSAHALTIHPPPAVTPIVQTSAALAPSAQSAAIGKGNSATRVHGDTPEIQATAPRTTDVQCQVVGKLIPVILCNNGQKKFDISRKIITLRSPNARRVNARKIRRGGSAVTRGEGRAVVRKTGPNLVSRIGSKTVPRIAPKPWFRIAPNNLDRIVPDVPSQIVPKVSSQIDSKDSSQIDPNVSSQIDPKVPSQIDPRTVIQIGSKLPSQIEPKVLSQIDPKVSSQIEPKVLSQIDPKISSQIDPKISSQIDPKVSSQIEPKVLSQIEPKISTQIDPKVSSQIEPKILSQIEPKISAQIDPKVSSQIEPKVLSQIDPKISSQSDPKVSSQIDPKISPQIGPNIPSPIATSSYKNDGGAETDETSEVGPEASATIPDVSEDIEDDEEMSRKLKDAIKAAEAKLKGLKGVKKLKLTIDLENFEPTVHFVKGAPEKDEVVASKNQSLASLEQMTSSLQSCSTTNVTDMATATKTTVPTETVTSKKQFILRRNSIANTPGNNTVINNTIVKSNTPVAVNNTMSIESTPKPTTPVAPANNTATKTTKAPLILNLKFMNDKPVLTAAAPPEGVAGLSTVSVEAYLRGKDPSKLRIMCVDQVRVRCAQAQSHLFLTEIEYEVDNPVYLTIVAWKYAQRIRFEKEVGGASSSAAQLPSLLEGGPVPARLTLGDKHYRKLKDQPLIYAQVFSMVCEPRECRRLLMDGRPVWAYCKDSGQLSAIKMATIAANNVGLMCDDNMAVQVLVSMLNTLGKMPPNQPSIQQNVSSGHKVGARGRPKTGTYVPLTSSTKVTPNGIRITPAASQPGEVIEIDSDSDIDVT